MASSEIKQLLKNPCIWQASQQAAAFPVITTGYQALDKKLHYGGWPQASICELSVDNWGMGELRLLMPGLSLLKEKSAYICWINPPYTPYAPALAEYIDLNQLLIVAPENTSDAIWAAQQALSSNACSAVLLWLTEKVADKQIRKLTIAAKQGNCWGFVLLRTINSQATSAAKLRLRLQVKQAHQQISIIKQPGGWAGQKVMLDLFAQRAYWNSASGKNWPTEA